MEKGKEPSESGNLMDTIHPLSKAASVPSFAEENPRGQYKRRVREEDQADASPGVESASLFRDSSGIDPEPENKQSELRERAREKAGIDSSCGEENKRLLGFACPDCCDFELELAKAALKFFEDKNKGTGEYEVEEVLAVCFAYSWPVKKSATGYSWHRSGEELCHISFSAKPKSNGDFSLKWFFAELSKSGNRVFCVTHAQVMDPYDSGLRYGCSFCPPHMLYPHPSGSELYRKVLCGGRSALQFKHRHKK